MKKILALVLALCLSILPTTAYAADFETSTDNVGYVLYQSEPESVQLADVPAPIASYSGSIEIPAGKWETGSFTVKNPHTLILKTKCALTLESGNPNAEMHVVLHTGLTALANVYIKAGETLEFEFNNHSSEYVVTYYVNQTNSRYGMKLTCTLS